MAVTSKAGIGGVKTDLTGCIANVGGIEYAIPYALANVDGIEVVIPFGEQVNTPVLSLRGALGGTATTWGVLTTTSASNTVAGLGFGASGALYGTDRILAGTLFDNPQDIEVEIGTVICLVDTSTKNGECTLNGSVPQTTDYPYYFRILGDTTVTFIQMNDREADDTTGSSIEMDMEVTGDAEYMTLDEYKAEFPG